MNPRFCNRSVRIINAVIARNFRLNFCVFLAVPRDFRRSSVISRIGIQPIVVTVTKMRRVENEKRFIRLFCAIHKVENEIQLNIRRVRVKPKIFLRFGRIRPKLDWLRIRRIVHQLNARHPIVAISAIRSHFFARIHIHVSFIAIDNFFDDLKICVRIFVEPSPPGVKQPSSKPNYVITFI